MSDGFETKFIFRQSCRGEPEALASLRERQHEPLRNILFARGATATEAEDLLADMWADCVPVADDKPTLLDKFNGGCSIQGWLATVLTNRWIDLKRKEWRKAELVSGDDATAADDPEAACAPLARDDTLLELLHRSIREAFAHSSAQALVILRLVHEQGLTQREICRMAGWSESKVSRLLSETMAQIQKDALRALKASDPWLELSWDDLVAMCEVYQNGFF